MRILWVTDVANPDPRAGGGLRSLRLVQALAADWPVDVLNVGAGLQADAYLAVTGVSTAESALTDRRTKWATLLLAGRQLMPLPAVRSFSSEIAVAIAAAAATGDLIVLENRSTLGHLPRIGTVLVVLSDVPSDMTRHLPVVGLRRAERRWNAWAYRHLERRLLRRPHTAVVVVSERDRQLIPTAFVVPNGCDLPQHVGPVPSEGPLLFVASMDYPPNIEAVRWWSDEVWPGSGLPPLTVVGRGAGADLQSPAVEVVGEVADVAPWLHKARLVVVPLRSGSGTRLKVIEAMAHGRPVVSTSKGVEGLDLVDQALIADSPRAFGLAVRRLLDDPELAQRLASSGRQATLSMDWGPIGSQLQRLVRDLAARRP